MASPDPHDLSSDDMVLSHFTLGRHHDITQRVVAAATAGCAGIGLYLRDHQRLEAAGSAEQLADLLDEHGLCLSEIDALRSWADPAVAATADAMEQEAVAFRMADQFRCRSLHVLGPDGGSIAEIATAFGALCDRAVDHGLLVALEFMPTTCVATAADALRVVEAAERDNGGVCVDVWHHERGADDLELIRSLPGERVIDVQMSDGPRRPVGDDYERDTARNRLAPGDGEFDLTGFVAAIRATGTSAPWALEVCNEDAWNTDGTAFVERCATGLRRLLGSDQS